MPNGAARTLFFCFYKTSQRAHVRSPSLDRNGSVVSVGFLSLVVWYNDIRGGAENSCQVELGILTWRNGCSIRQHQCMIGLKGDHWSHRSAWYFFFLSSASDGFVLGRITAPVDSVTYPLSLDCGSQGHHLAR